MFKIQIGDTLDKDINWAVELSLWVENDKRVKTVKKEGKKKRVKSKRSEKQKWQWGFRQIWSLHGWRRIKGRITPNSRS